MNENRKLQREQLKHFEPLAELSDARLDELLSLVCSEKFTMGANLFREGDIENRTMYLLFGDVQLSSSDGRIDTIVQHTGEQARYPLDDSQPRQSSCISITPVEVLCIDNSILDYMMMWDQVGISVELEKQEESVDKAEIETGEETEEVARSTGKNAANTDAENAAEVAETIASENITDTVNVTDQDRRERLDEPDKDQVQAVRPTAPAKQNTAKITAAESANDDRAWIRKMSHIMAFKSMPPANIKYLLDKMEAVQIKAGEDVVQQGESGDYYYVLVDGKARVTRTVELATLEPGRSFGEEALLSGSQRNASVTMLEDGVVMRLDKRDFDDMLREPMLNRIAPSEARLKVAQGACWLDIRHAKEFNYSHLPGAMNIPLHELRLRIEELDRDVHYICYCRTGHRSSATAFLLVQNGFNASVLNGGVQVMAQDLITE